MKQKLQPKHLIALGAICFALAGSLVGVHYTQPSTHQAATGPFVGQTLSVASTQTDPRKATDFVNTGVQDLKHTTISGVKFYRNFRESGYWFSGIQKLTLAQALSSNKALYDVAGDHIQQTTISGSAYAVNPSKYVNGHWDLAFRTYNSILSELSNQLPTLPTINVVP